MKVRVEFVGPVARPGDAREMDQELPPEATAEDLLVVLRYAPSHRRAVGVFRDGERLAPMARLADGDRLSIAIPFGGG